MYHVQTVYNIKQAAARAGVTVPVLRAWERRYGIVNPGRTASGYRQFDEDSVARVRTMRTMVDAGWSPSAAAAAILDGTAPEAVVATGGAGPVGPGPDVSLNETNAITDRFIAAARAMDPQAAVAVLDEVFARGSFERVMTDLLFPALHRLGEAWASGDVSVAGEHMVSGAVHRRLGNMLEAAGSAIPIDMKDRVVVGLPSGSRHELGALAFAVAARRAGIPVTYLGTDLPIDDWVAAATNARGAVIGAVIPGDRGGAVDVARRLRTEYPELLVAIGGRSATETPGFLLLPTGLTESVAALKDALSVRSGARA
jgi:MerR family transcriptional regulator, light-induced transcriptional regulator